MHRLAKNKQKRNEQKTTNKSPRRPLPQPHTTRRELELQCSKESLGAGLRSDKSIATKGHQVSEPNTQAVGPRGQLRFGERELPRSRRGWGQGRGSDCPFLEAGKAVQLLPLASKAEPPRPAPGWRPTMGRPGNETGSNCGLHGVRNVTQKQVDFLDCSLAPAPIPPCHPQGGGRGTWRGRGQQVPVDLKSKQRPVLGEEVQRQLLLPSAGCLLNPLIAVSPSCRRPQKPFRLHWCWGKQSGGGRGWKRQNSLRVLHVHLGRLETPGSDAPRR